MNQRMWWPLILWLGTADAQQGVLAAKLGGCLVEVKSETVG